ncbi:hypothetical protein C8J57DRAFT_1729346 [Mycena rebaudengoi]|nr:hypothetical protein C8J57DRAFT_1729346 [Mycena rebaudengoi]
MHSTSGGRVHLNRASKVLEPSPKACYTVHMFGIRRNEKAAVHVTIYGPRCSSACLGLRMVQLVSSCQRVPDTSHHGVGTVRVVDATSAARGTHQALGSCVHCVAMRVVVFPTHIVSLAPKGVGLGGAFFAGNHRVLSSSDPSPDCFSTLEHRLVVPAVEMAVSLPWVVFVAGVVCVSLDLRGVGADHPFSLRHGAREAALLGPVCAFSDLGPPARPASTCAANIAELRLTLAARNDHFGARHFLKEQLPCIRFANPQLKIHVEKRNKTPKDEWRPELELQFRDGTAHTLSLHAKWSTAILTELMDTARSPTWERWRAEAARTRVPPFPGAELPPSHSPHAPTAPEPRFSFREWLAQRPKKRFRKSPSTRRGRYEEEIVRRRVHNGKRLTQGHSV